MQQLIPVYISKTTASLDRANLPDDADVEIKWYNTQVTAQAVVKRLREEKNSARLLANLYPKIWNLNHE